MIPQEKPQRSIKLKSRILPIFVMILVGLQMFFPFKGWVILLTGFGGMWLLSYLWARSLYSGLHIEREMRFGWKQVGDRLLERIFLRNNSWAPSLWVEIDDHSNMNEYDISSVSDIQGYRHRNWHTQGFCDTRGLYTLGPVTLRAEDPFGVYQVTIDYTNSANMMVVPPVIALPEIEIASGGRVGEGRSSVKGVEQTISTVGVREYVPGDSLRFLHWPTVARMGNLYVHLFDSEPSSDWWVLLDMDPHVQVGDGSRSTEEHGVVLAASMVNRGILMGKQVGLVTYGDDLIWHPPDIGTAHLWTILRSLATIRAGGPPLDQILARLRTSLEPNTSLAIISPNLSPIWINALELLKRSGIVATVLILDPVSFGGTGDVEIFRRSLRKLGITHYTISADLLDQPKKKPKGLRWLIEQTRLRGNHFNKWQVRWQKISRSLRTWALILVFYFVMTNLLASTIRGLDTNLIWFLVAGGILLGWLLVKSSLRGWLAALLSALIGLGIAVLRVGRFGNPLYGVLVRGSEVAGQIWADIFKDAEPANLEALQLQLHKIWIGIGGLAERLVYWSTAIVRGQAYYDPVANTILWSIAIWGVVIWAMWAIFRLNKPFPAFLPSIALVSFSLALAGQASYDLTFMVGATIALMAFINHDAHERKWLRDQLTFQTTIRGRVFAAALVLTFGLMVFSLITPTISIAFLNDLARRATGTEASDSALAQNLGIENQGSSQDIDILDASRQGGFPNEHLINSSSDLSDQVVMVVQVDTSQSGIPQEMIAEAFSPLYLRSLVYDHYLGSGWASRDTNTVDYSPGAQIQAGESNRARPIRQQVQFVDAEGGFMYTVGTPLSADQDFRVAWRLQNEAANEFDLFGATVDQETYRADSLVQIQPVDELRSAGQVYPSWIIDRYMTLPASVPESVLTLARDLTATETNPYDRAVAIEKYLRQFPYTLDVTTGPAGADITEYFLFVLQKGYCDYYATAMVVLARAAGMPARYVIGYIGEYYDESLGAYIITADQAHAWPEIYFPEYGWIQFEPTSGRPPLERPPEAFPELPADFQLDFAPLVPERSFSLDHGPMIFWVTLLSVIILTLLVWTISDVWLARLPADKQLPKNFRRLYRYGSWMRLPAQPGLTPSEFANYLDDHLKQLAAGSYWRDWLLAGSDMIYQITSAYVQVLFYPASAANLDSKAIMKIYKKLRLRLWLLWLLGRVYKFWVLRPFFWSEAPLIITYPVEEEL